MSQSTSTKQQSIRKQFPNLSSAEASQSKLEKEGIDPKHITLKTQLFQKRLKFNDTQAFANLKFGAVVGSVLGALIGLFISLLSTHFFSLGLVAFSNFQTIHYFAPLMGAIVGAAGMSLITGISGTSTPKPDNPDKTPPLTKKYFLVVQGTIDEISLAKKIFHEKSD